MFIAMSRHVVVVVFVLILFSLLHLGQCQADVCQNVHCGSGICITTQNPSLPYFCRCPSGSNTILPCPMENPCSRSPCGQGVCEVVPSLLHGYLCRCAGDVISLTSCNVTRSGCNANPCNNGLCIEGIANFFCHCLPTWTGKYCNEKIQTPCSNNPCNTGKCFELNDLAIPYVCLCPNGQFGLTCQRLDLSYLTSTARVFPPMLTTSRPTTTTTTTTTTTPRMRTTTRSSHICNPYDEDSCMNGGRCLATIHSFRCLCQAGFTGVMCEMNINECASNPCQYGGTCYDLQASYMCYCPDGKFRSQCLPPIVATSTSRTLVCPCQNGGVCSTIGLQSCVCPVGFTGRYCERSLQADSCSQIQCLNGGICYANVTSITGSLQCTCKPGFTGKYCEIEYFRCRANGRFADRYHCIHGKYFECIHYHQDAAANPYGTLLSRSCPVSLRFNVQADRCDYPHNVKCLEI